MHHDQEEADDTKLKGLDVNGGFTTPPQYFSHLHNHILNRTVRISSEVPEGYFERSRSAILQKTIGTVPVSKPLTVWYRRPLYKYVAAASVMVCLSLVLWSPKQSTSTITSENISEEEIMNYLEHTDLRDVNIIDVNFSSLSPAGAEVEQYIISQSDDQLLENL